MAPRRCLRLTEGNVISTTKDEFTEAAGPGNVAGQDGAARVLRFSLALGRYVDFFGRWGSLFVIPLVLVTMFDVIARKLIWIQIFLVEHVSRYFGSTMLQELEWHFHTALFTLVLGYGYVHNSHVRVDLIREKLNFRKQAWIEFTGCTFFMLPYCIVVVFFAFHFAYQSFIIGEISASLVGLSHRWIIKTVLAFGLILAFLAGIAVWLQTVLVLFGPRDLRFKLMTLEWPEQQDLKRIRTDAEPDGQTEVKQTEAQAS